MSGSHRRSAHGRHKNEKSYKTYVGDKAKEVLEHLDENNPVIRMFREHCTELDDKHDRYERLVKLSRDITIESKRVIFLLHNSDLDVESKRESVLREASSRLNQLVDKNFQAIARELDGHDPYLYVKAYTCGMQEFIEALVFYKYLKDNTFETWAEINEKFTYNYDIQTESNETEQNQVALLFPQTDFILGIADFTGELMRKCINSLGSGNVDDCFKICKFVKFIYTGFKGLNCFGQKEISRKMYVLYQSLSKIELVCYNIRIRGSEVPKHMLANVINAAEVNADEDEGYY